MASICRNKKTGLWTLWYCLNGKRYAKNLKTKDEKEARFRKKEHEVLLERGEIKETKQILVEAYLEEYKYDTSYRAKSTNTSEASIVRRFVEFTKKKTINSMDRDDIVRFMERYLKLAPKSHNEALQALKRFFRFAVKHEYIPKNPVEGFHRQKVPQKLPHFFTDEEYTKIEQEAATMVGSCVYPMIVTARYTGMRLGELLALEWVDWDWEKKLVRVVNKPFHTVKNYLCRTVPISDELRDKLLPYIRPTGLCFQKPGDGMYEHEGPRRDLRTIFRNVGIDPKERKGWHEFRHTFASRLVQNNVPIYKVCKWLGHSSVLVTQIYAHFAPVYDDDIEKLVINAVSNGSSPEKFNGS